MPYRILAGNDATLETTLWMQKFWNSWFLVSILDMFLILESCFDALGGVGRYKNL